MNHDQIRGVQRTLNGFTHKWLKGVRPIRVDGVKGRSTNSRIMLVKFYCGWGKRGSAVDHATLERFRSPKSGRLFPPKMLIEGRKRRARQRRAWAAEHVRSVFSPGVTRFDGKPVAKAAVPRLIYARRRGWRGYLVSGWRSPAYSDSLCRNMCGRSSCPGRCAGRASNHAGSSPGRFAVDVSDYARFGYLMRSGRQGIYNRLGARDPVHFSPSGN